MWVSKFLDPVCQRDVEPVCPKMCEFFIALIKEVGMGLEILGKSHVLLIILIVAFTFYIYMQAFDFLDPYFGEFVI